MAVKDHILKVLTLAPAPVVKWIDAHPRLHQMAARVYHRFIGDGWSHKLENGPLAGVSLAMDRAMGAYAWRRPLEEGDVLKAIDATTSAGSVVFDIGANFGYYTLVLARQVGASGL